MTTALFNCPSGVSGDMLLGALVDAGAPLDRIERAIRTVAPTGWSIGCERVDRGGLAATRILVSLTEEPPAGHPAGRSAHQIVELVATAGLPVADRAVRALVAAEAKVHRNDPRETQLHEVGGLDAVVDIVGTAAALDVLEIDEVWVSPIATGSGVVDAEHGPLPVPAPAVVEIAAGARLALRLVDSTAELTTPTGVALLAGAGGRHCADPLVPSQQGFGAGARNLVERPNVVQVIIGSPATSAHSGDGARSSHVGTSESMLELAMNVDDATPEVLAFAVEQAFAAGAADAWLAPVVMKKGRPAVTVHALASPGRAAKVEAVLLHETGSLGVRRTAVERLALDRDAVTVSIDGHPVRVKRALRESVPMSWSAEYEDAKTVAAETGRSVRDVMSAAVAAARQFEP